MTVPPSVINEEYVLLIGGENSSAVFKFNLTWTNFGKLKKPRQDHNCIYWNEGVYVFGGLHDFGDENGTKTEIWKINDSPNEFKTSENWPELDNWSDPHLFIVPDSFFPEK